MNKKTNEDWKNHFSKKLNVLNVLMGLTLFGVCVLGWYGHSVKDKISKISNNPGEATKEVMNAVVPGFGTWVKLGLCAGIALVGVVIAILITAWISPDARPLIYKILGFGLVTFFGALWYIPNSTTDSSKG